MVTPDGERPGCVAVSGGTIAAVEPPAAGLTARNAAQVVELGDDVVLLPGLVDTHVHVNDPGRADWEGFSTATAAAAAGGVTTIVDMPLNSLPPTVDPAALAVKRAAAAGRCDVDVAFWGGAIPGNGAQFGPLHEDGVLGFKCFLLPSGVDEFPPLSPAELEADLAVVAALLGSQMIVHAEDPHVIERAPEAAGRGVRDVPAVPAGRRGDPGHRARAGPCPPDRGPGAHPAPVQRGSVRADPRRARGGSPGHGRDLPALPGVQRGGGTRRRDPVQVLPADPRGGEPGTAVVRAGGRHHRLRGVRSFALHTGPETAGYRGLRRGVGRDRVVAAAPPAVLLQARSRGFGLARVARWMAERPAAIAGLERKGAIEPGRDADFWPTSLPVTIRGSSGTRASNGRPSSRARRSPPPDPKMGDGLPQCWHSR